MNDYNNNPALGGIKKDAGKRLWSLLPDFLLEGVVDVLMVGADKYTAFNWTKGMPYSRVYNSARRHLTAWFWKKEDLDPESSLHHLDHAICNLLFLRYYTMRYPDRDDRVDLLGAKSGAASSSDVSDNTAREAIQTDQVQTEVRSESTPYAHRTTLSQSGRPSKAGAWLNLDDLKPGTILFQSPSPAKGLSFDEALAHVRALQKETGE